VESRWRKIAHESISKLKKWFKTSENYKNKLSLLQAEMASLNNDNSNAVVLYENAMTLAKNNKFLHEEALAYERAGMIFLQTHFIDKASFCLSHSCRLYMLWGAKAKVNHLRQLYPALIIEKYIFDSPSPSLGCWNNKDTFSTLVVSAPTSMGEKSLLPKNKKARMFCPSK